MFKTSAFGIQKVILTMSMAFLLLTGSFFFTHTVHAVSSPTIETLTTQIAALTKILNQLLAERESATANSPTSQNDLCQYANAVTKTLSEGMKDTQVISLQKFLNRTGAPIASTGAGSSGNETSYFGAGTERAVQQWQTKNNVVSIGSPETTGYGVVGAATRAKMRQVCGSTMTVDENIFPGDQLGEYKGYLGRSHTPFITTKDITKADALANCKTNQKNNPTKSIMCTWNGVEIFAFTPTTASPSVKISLPTENSTFKVGDIIPIKYSYANVPPKSQIEVTVAAVKLLDGGVSGGTWQSSEIVNTSGTDTYNKQTGPGYLDAPGTYKISAVVKTCNVSGCNYAPAGKAVSPYSNDVTITIVASAPAPAPALTLLSPVTNVTYAATDSMTVRWSATNLPSSGYFIVLLKNGTKEYPIVTKTLSDVSATFPIQYQTNIVPGTYNVMVKLVNNSNASQSTSVIGNSTVTIKPATAPVVTNSWITAYSNPATLISTSSARLNGVVSAHGLANVTASFRYGTDVNTCKGSGQDTIVGAVPSSITGTASTTIYQVIKNLKPNTTYYSCIESSNGVNGTPSVNVRSFTTLPAERVPTATITLPTNIVSGTNVTFSGTATNINTVYVAFTSTNGSTNASDVNVVGGKWSMSFSDTFVAGNTYTVTVRAATDVMNSGKGAVLGNAVITVPRPISSVSSEDYTLTSGAQTQVNSNFTEDLFRGTQGTQVKLLQQVLAKEGLFTEKVTGNFYDVTLEAVRAFQVRYGIKPTGYVGAATRSILNTK